MVKTSKLVLDSLLGEIEQADAEMFPPKQAVTSQDKPVGVIEDVFLKKLFSLTMFYRRESDRVVANLKYEPDNKEMESEYRSLKDRADLYHDLFLASGARVLFTVASALRGLKKELGNCRNNISGG